MLELPVVGCGLDQAGLDAQLTRYRALAAHVAESRRAPAELEVGFASTVDAGLLAETVAVERGCCPFFTLELTGARLRITAADPERRPALAAVADALGA